MLRLSDCLGTEVTDGTGRRRGRLADLEVTLDQAYPAVDALVVRAARGLRTTSAALHRLSPGELSELVARLPPERAAQALHAVEEERAAAALSVARPRLGGQLVSALPRHGAARLLAAMPVDDAVAILRPLEAGRRETLLAGVPPTRASELRRLLAYPTGTAGGLMTTDIRTADGASRCPTSCAASRPTRRRSRACSPCS
jgi:flagellar motility protein MotE (MotC chaperone)